MNYVVNFITAIWNPCCKEEIICVMSDLYSASYVSDERRGFHCFGNFFFLHNILKISKREKNTVLWICRHVDCIDFLMF